MNIIETLGLSATPNQIAQTGPNGERTNPDRWARPHIQLHETIVKTTTTLRTFHLNQSTHSVTMSNTANGHSRVLKPGVWAPIPTFFHDNEDLGKFSGSRPRLFPDLSTSDLDTFKSHVLRLAKSGMWPVVCGSMGEAHHLSHEERVALFKAARQVLDEAGLNDVVIIAGT
jgi:hypothetical protein